MNDNQNNYVRPGRTTSRVLAPSGGQSSLTFGLLPTPKITPPPVVTSPAVVTDVSTKIDEQKSVLTDVIPTVVSDESAAAESPAISDNTETTVTTGTDAADTPSKKVFTSALLPSQQKELDNKVSQNAFVSGSNMNGGCVMTGRPSSRVLAPPGGHTSIKLG